MISAARTMKPLPVPPLDRVGAGDNGPQPPVVSTSRVKLPLPMPPRLDGPDMTDALRNAAFERMMTRLNIVQPLPVDDRLG